MCKHAGSSALWVSYGTEFLLVQCDNYITSWYVILSICLDTRCPRCMTVGYILLASTSDIKGLVNFLTWVFALICTQYCNCMSV